MTADIFTEGQKIIKEVKNIYILPSEKNWGESISASLALFYTLKKLNKNVNLVIEEIPDKLHFLIPSLNFISYPKDFVISVRGKDAGISQVRYEKNEENLKIYLTLDKGNIKKDDISFSFFSCKPDLLITVGVADLDSIRANNPGLVLGTPIINIDNQKENTKFGSYNLIGDNSLAELVTNFVKSLDAGLFDQNIATCLLTAVIIFSDNFKSPKTSPEIFEATAFLTKQGALHQEIIQNLYKSKSPSQIKILGKIIQDLNFDKKTSVSWGIFDAPEFQNLEFSDLGFSAEYLKENFNFQNLLLLWKSHSSGPATKILFYSEKKDLIKKVFNSFQGVIDKDTLFSTVSNLDLESVKNKILEALNQ